MLKTLAFRRTLAVASTAITLCTVGSVAINAGPIAKHSELAASTSGAVTNSVDSTSFASPGADSRVSGHRVSPPRRVSGPRDSGSRCRVSTQVGPHCDYAIDNVLYAYTYEGVTYVDGGVTDSDPRSNVRELGVAIFFPDGFVAFPQLSKNTTTFFSGQYIYSVSHKVAGPERSDSVISVASDRAGASSVASQYILVGQPRVSG